MSRDDSPGTPCCFVLLSGTLALMTAYGAPDDSAVDTCRSLIARKIVSNLFFLQHHPDLPEGLCRVSARLHERWSARCAGTPDLAAVAPATPAALH